VRVFSSYLGHMYELIYFFFIELKAVANFDMSMSQLVVLTIVVMYLKRQTSIYFKTAR
jgi:hypothetical protein